MVAVSDRRLLVAPRSAWMTVGVVRAPAERREGRGHVSALVRAPGGASVRGARGGAAADGLRAGTEGRACLRRRARAPPGAAPLVASPGPATVHARVEDGWGFLRSARTRDAAVALLSLTAALLHADGGRLPVARAQTPGPPNIVLVSPTIGPVRHTPSDAQRPGAGGGRDDAPPGDRDQRAVLSLTGDDPHGPVLAHHERVLQRRSRGRVGGVPPSESDTVATALDAAGYRTGLIGSTSTATSATTSTSHRAGIAGPRSRRRTAGISTTGCSTTPTVRGARFGATGLLDGRIPSSVVGVREQHAGRHAAVPDGRHVRAPARSSPAPRHDGTFRNAPGPPRPGGQRAQRGGQARLHPRPADLVLRRAADADAEPVGDAARRRPASREDRPGAPRHRSALNTLFIFTSDNGLLNQEHRWAARRFPTRSRSGFRW